MSSGSWARAAVAIAVRPRLWPTGLRLVARYRRPTREYIGFRMITAYGDAGAAPHPDDAVAYLEWVRAWDAAIGR